MANLGTQAEIEAQVEQILPTLRDKSDRALQLRVDFLRIAEGASQLGQSGRAMSINSAAEQPKTWDELFRAIEQTPEPLDLARDTVCRSREDIEDTISVQNVAALVALLATVFPGFVVAEALIAMALLIFRMGLRQYCRN